MAGELGHIRSCRILKRSMRLRPVWAAWRRYRPRRASCRMAKDALERGEKTMLSDW